MQLVCRSSPVRPSSLPIPRTFIRENGTLTPDSSHRIKALKPENSVASYSSPCSRTASTPPTKAFVSVTMISYVYCRSTRSSRIAAYPTRKIILFAIRRYCRTLDTIPPRPGGSILLLGRVREDVPTESGNFNLKVRDVVFRGDGWRGYPYEGGGVDLLSSAAQ